MLTVNELGYEVRLEVALKTQGGTIFNGISYQYVLVVVISHAISQQKQQCYVIIISMF